jgi:YfiH family protein
MTNNLAPIHSHKIPIGRIEVYTSRPEIDFTHLKQTHSCLLLPEEICQFGLIEGDGFLQAQEKRNPLAIKTADCLPIFILGKNGFSFLHAGWRGLANGIITQGAIQQLDPIYAYIGPSIRQNAFEVTEEFYQHFSSYPHRFSRQNGKHYFDLQNAARDMLKRLNPKMDIEDSGICTYDNRDFNSFRRDKNQERNWNILQFS